MCKEEVSKRGRIERRQRIERAHREHNVESSEPSNVTLKRSTQEPFGDESQILQWLAEHAGCILSRCQKVVTGKRHSKNCMARNHHNNFAPFCEKVLVGKANLHRSHEQNESQILVRNLAWNAKKQIENADGVFTALKSEDWNRRADGTRKPSRT